MHPPVNSKIVELILITVFEVLREQTRSFCDSSIIVNAKKLDMSLHEIILLFRRHIFFSFPKDFCNS